MAKFISNGIGINSVEDDAVIPEGWNEITEAEAKAANPALFGEVPPAEAPAEIVEKIEKAKKAIKKEAAAEAPADEQ